VKQLNDGDFIKIEFEMRVGEDKKLVSTSKADLAKQNDIFDEDARYGDIVVIVGQEGIFKEVNEAFRKAEPGQEVEVEVPPEDAFGQRLPSNIKIHTMREFQRLNIDPQVGKEVEINRRVGRIISVTPGRVLVDYNHRWAGKTVYYKFKINGVITDPVEKVKAIIANNYNPEGFNVTLDSDIKIEIPEGAKFSLPWLDAKYNIVNTVRKYVPGYDIVMLEVYKKQEEQKAEGEQKEESAPSEAKAEASESQPDQKQENVKN